MEAREIPLSELISSDLNPRTSVSQKFLDRLKTSIKTVGVMTPLAVRKNGKGYIVVDGNTRLSALKELNSDGAPCVVLDQDEQFNDTQFALVANQIRQPIDPWDESAAFFNMIVTDGLSIKEVAKVYGTTTNHVKQRVALAELHPQFRAWWAGNQIDMDALQYMTRVDKDIQKQFVEDHKDYESVISYYTVEIYCRRYTYNPVNAIFGTKQLDKLLVKDLFGSADYIQDTAKFKELQIAAILDMVDGFLSRWPETETEHLTFDSDLWTAVDTFSQNYNMITWRALDAHTDWNQLSRLYDEWEKVEKVPEVIHIHSDSRMNVRILFGNIKSSTADKPQTDTPVREYSGVLQDMCRRMWKLALVEHFLKQPKLAASYLHATAWHFARGSVIKFPDNDDKELGKRIKAVNTKLTTSITKSKSSDDTVSRLAGRYIYENGWNSVSDWLLSLNKSVIKQIADEVRPERFVFTKMKKPMLEKLLKDLAQEEPAGMSKQELIDAVFSSAREKKWAPPLDELN